MPHGERDYMGTRNPEFTTYEDAHKDNLPLDGEVYVKGDVRVHVYWGHHAQDFDKCMVMVKGEPSTKRWVDRSQITLPADA